MNGNINRPRHGAAPAFRDADAVVHLRRQWFLPDSHLPMDVHRWSPPARNTAHDHDFMEIALILEGTGIHESHSASTAYAPGDVFLIRPGIWHRYQPEGDNLESLTLYNCIFDPRSLHRELDWLYSEPKTSYLLTAGAHANGGTGILKLTLSTTGYRHAIEHLDVLNRILHSKCPSDQQAADDGSEGTPSVRMVAYLILFLEELTQHFSSSQRDAVRQTKTIHHAVIASLRLLEEEYRRPWTLADLSDQIHLDASYLVKLFKQSIGTPPIAYLNQIRCEHAAAMLRGTTLSVSEIAHAVGWDDANYFSRRFKSHFGQSPRSFRTGGASNNARLLQPK